MQLALAPINEKASEQKTSSLSRTLPWTPIPGVELDSPFARLLFRIRNYLPAEILQDPENLAQIEECLDVYGSATDQLITKHRQDFFELDRKHRPLLRYIAQEAGWSAGLCFQSIPKERYFDSANALIQIVGKLKRESGASFRYVNWEDTSPELKSEAELVRIHGQYASAIYQIPVHNLLEWEEAHRNDLLQLEAILEKNDVSPQARPMVIIYSHQKIESDSEKFLEFIDNLESNASEARWIAQPTWQTHKDFLVELSKYVRFNTFDAWRELDGKALAADPQALLKIAQFCGITTDQVFKHLPTDLFLKDSQKFVELADIYGEALSSILETFGDNILEQEPLYRKTATGLMPLLGAGAGKFFKTVPPTQWSSSTQFVLRYRENSGSMYNQGALQCELEQEERELRLVNTREFGIFGFHRYYDYKAQCLLLLKDNIANLDPQHNAHLPLAVAIVTRSDPADTFIGNSVLDTLTQLSRQTKLLVYEVDSKSKLDRAIKMAGSLHGLTEDGSSKKPIEVLFPIGHGSILGRLTLSQRIRPAQHERNKKKYLGPSDFMMMKKWAPYLATNLQVPWYNCYAAKGGKEGLNLATTFQYAHPSSRHIAQKEAGFMSNFQVRDLAPRENGSHRVKIDASFIEQTVELNPK